jgi:hypothetical protein
MTFYRKIGGIHWFAIGPWRISICRLRAKRVLREMPAQMFISAKTGRLEMLRPVRPKLPTITTFPFPPETHTD